MAETKNWFKRFLRWFRGDDLDELLRREDAVSGSGGFSALADGDLPLSAVTGAEAAALTGTGTATAVLDDADALSFRRHFLGDDADAPSDRPATVDEHYILTREAQATAPPTAADTDDDRVIGDTEGVTVTREAATPADAALAKVDAGVTEITRALTNVNTAVVQQTEIVERIGTTLCELPAAIHAQGVYLETLTRHVETQNARSGELAARLKDIPAALAAIPEQGRAQVQFLQAIAATLEGEADRSTALAKCVAGLASTVEVIDETTRRQQDVLVELQQSQASALEGIKETMRLHSKRYVWLLFLMWTVTVVTVGGVAFLTYLVTRHWPIGW